MNYLHLLHFLVQRGLLLASQEAIFNRPKYFFTKKIKCQLKVARAFVWSSVEWGEGECGGENVFFFYAFKMYLACG